jgi:hypothetical protein
VDHEGNRRPGPDWRSAPRLLFQVPLAVLGMCAVLLTLGASRLPGGVDLSNGPGAFLLLVAIVGALAFATRVAQPASRLAVGLESFALFFAVVLVATFASVSMAVGSGPFVVTTLIAIDRALFPFLDLKALILALPRYPVLYAVLEWVYNSMVWQPVAFLGVATLFGRPRDLEFFLSAWSVGLLLCLLPFHWLPALSPYNYYGIDQTLMPGVSVNMPWQFVPVMTGLRDGSIHTLTIDQLAGMVTVPSFHACAAAMLACSWWRFRLTRWPMLALNAAMALAAVPIGSHYAIDIVAGVAVGLAAARFAGWFLRRKDRVASYPPVAVQAALQPA